jgi:hypothetical protein
MAKWIATFGIHNVFTLMVMYFHWPFELAHHQTYQEGGGGEVFANRLDVVEERDRCREETDSDITARPVFPP